MNTRDFLQRVSQATQISPTDENWTPDEILNEATQCLFERFVRTIVNVRSGYWLQTQEITLVPGVSFYRISPRAVVQGLELFCLAAPGSSEWREIPVLTNSDAVRYQGRSGGSMPECFSFESDGIVLYPTPQYEVTLQMKFYLRPSQVLQTPGESAGTLNDPLFGQVIDTSDSDINRYVVAGEFDDFSGLYSSRFDLVNTDGSSEAIALDLVVNNVFDEPDGPTIELAQPLTTTQLAKLDMALDQGSLPAFVPAGYIWTIPLPVELHSALVSFTAAAILVDKGDAEKAAQLVSRCEASVKAIVDVMTPRVKTRPYTFKSRNSYLRRHC